MLPSVNLWKVSEQYYQLKFIMTVDFENETALVIGGTTFYLGEQYCKCLAWLPFKNIDILKMIFNIEMAF